MRIVFFSTIFFSQLLIASDAVPIPEGRETSPFKACKDVVLVDEGKYKKHQIKWDDYSAKCSKEIQLIQSAGFTELNPLKEGAEYLDFTNKIARKIQSNLKASQYHLECAIGCYNGKSKCTKNEIFPQDLSCSEVKENLVKKLNVATVRARTQLLLSSESGPVKATPSTVLKMADEDRLNLKMSSFEMALPNPFENLPATAREKNHAIDILKKERLSLSESAKKLNIEHEALWMSTSLLNKRDEHQSKYKQIIYEEAPILSVLQRPAAYDKSDNPLWNDNQLKIALASLLENSKKTYKKVEASITNGELEFNRYTGRSFYEWSKRQLPFAEDSYDLLYYMEFNNPIEEVLKENPKFCKTASTLRERITKKSLQNTAATMGVTLMTSSMVKETSSILAHGLRVGRSLSGKEASALTGLALGVTSVSDILFQTGQAEVQLQTKSGVIEGEKENIQTYEQLKEKETSSKITLAMTPLNIGSSWVISKALYNGLAKRMMQDMPEFKRLYSKTNISDSARDEMVDSWLNARIMMLFTSNEDRQYLSSRAAKNAVDDISKEILKKDPQFFNNADNVDIFLKFVLNSIKTQKDDPSDLSLKLKDLFYKFDFKLLNTWDVKEKNGLMSIFENYATELRFLAKNDPASYAKISTSPEIVETVYRKALVRSGVLNENTASEMLQCVLGS